MLGFGVYFFTPYFNSSPLNSSLISISPTPNISPSDIEVLSLELDLTALDRDLNEDDNLESEFNIEVSSFNKSVLELIAIVDKYLDQMTKIIDRSEGLLDEVQTRVVKAEAKGSSTAQLDRLMNESRSRVASAEAKLSEVERLKSIAKSKANFITIRDLFKSAKINLQLTKQNSSEMINLLKSFNSR